MKPINIYALTRVSEAERIERMERQMSGRSRMIKAREWEMGSLGSFFDELCTIMPGAVSLQFFYSFCLPKLGKEFDLLRIDEDSVINIELKSESVTDKAIQKQLLQNRYYLAMLGRSMHFFTYISSTRKLYRLSNSGRLIEGAFEDLAALLAGQKECYDGDIEDLFMENQYLISPLTDPGRFLRRDYFLTSQQWDIKRKIIRNIKNCSEKAGNGDELLIQGFTGLPGTGKTILLYDLALWFSESEKVCIFHFGAHPGGIDELNERLKRVDFYYCEKNEDIVVPFVYKTIFVDEGHRIDAATWERICQYAKAWHAPVIVSYDSEVPIAPQERKEQSTDTLESVPGFIRYQLTNRIRLNNEMSAFIQCLMCVGGWIWRRDYPNVSLVYANNPDEAEKLTGVFTEEGYVYVRDRLVDQKGYPVSGQTVEVSEATSREFDNVVMLVDESFCYDEAGYLRSAISLGDGRVRHLYHGLNRAKKKIAVVILDNLAVFDRLLGILQRAGR